MKAGLFQFNSGARRGSAMLSAMCFTIVLMIAIGGYITVCYRSLEMSNRSLQSTRGIELAEIGMEEALWALNKNDWSTWTIAGTTATKSMTGFSYDNGVTGSVALTVTNFSGTTGSRTVTVTGTTTLADGTQISRTVTSTSSRAPLFVNAVAATTSRVRFRSGGTVDSYDSRLGDYSVQTPTFSAIISSSSTSTSSATVQLTNAQIKGYVATLSTGPSYSTSARLIGPTTPGTTKIDSSRISTSPYQPVFSEIVPSASTILPSGTASVGSASDTTPALYYASEISLNGNQTLTINGPVTIVVAGNFSISNSARIRIATTGSLTLHVDGDISIGGNGIENLTKLPKNLAIFSTTNPYDSFTMATNQTFYGVIYTPVSSFTISNSQTIYGAIVAKQVTFSASPVIHYDVALRDEVFSGLDTPFAISGWRETTDAEE